MSPNFNNITAAGITYKSPETPQCRLHWLDPNGHSNFWCPVDIDWFQYPFYFKAGSNRGSNRIYKANE